MQEEESQSQNPQPQDQGQTQSQTQAPASSSASGTQPMETKNPRRITKFLPLLSMVVVIGAGIFTGLVLTSANKAKSLSGEVLSEEDLSPEIKENLAQTFRDEAEGTLEKNDELDKYAQGTHKLIRPGGEDQTAYLTSSVLDLDEYVGKQIKVYGETFGSSQVGWLMDVGKVEVLD